ncbi:hypothetical protein GXM_03218 [Nostoc sphaeroides CCNUC1]|uniref:Uncharacterized protein n=1 Tax=Nostoc sphaeroides CCNUC1 TaxID=2653204 RepID=A0A5P8VZI5_9NOSO|nr:hypothetical protein GXM_03218 [Nostoc sphaeroides CCNUC1]
MILTQEREIQNSPALFDTIYTNIRYILSPQSTLKIKIEGI